MSPCSYLWFHISEKPKYRHFCPLWEVGGKFHYLKAKMEDPEKEDDKNEKLEHEIYNMQHIFNLYQALIKKTNLIELILILFIKHYNFYMLGLVLQNNTNLKVLEKKHDR